MSPKSGKKRRHEIGLISDTHGLVRPEALRALRGVELIIHAGDVGKPEVVEALRSVAPVIAVRGNNDTGRWARRFPETKLIKASGLKIFVLHDVKELKLHPSPSKAEVVVSGHSHRPSVSRLNGVLFVNPGSAGPRRFALPVTVGRLRVTNRGVAARIVELKF